jgi:GNAT superfamily N-acetyltransferase
VSDAITIRAAAASDEPAWTQLWQAYCDFYETTVSAATTAATWRRILDPDHTISALVAVERDEIVGFANYLLHPRTWSERSACYLEDLFVAPVSRGRGAGRRLLEHLRAMSAEHDWSPLYWLTQESNATARALYDGFVPADGFVRYSIPGEV